MFVHPDHSIKLEVRRVLVRFTGAENLLEKEAIGHVI